MALGLTIAWLFAVLGLGFSRWDQASALKLNEIGDFLAGTFSPIAFLWLVVAVFLQKAELESQREELRQSRMALELQAEELKKSVAQFSEQTKIMKENLTLEVYDRKWEEIDQELAILANAFPNYFYRTTIAFGEDARGDPKKLICAWQHGGQC